MGKERVETQKETASKVYITKPASTLGRWSLILLGNFGRVAHMVFVVVVILPQRGSWDVFH